ncbi:arsenate reductase (glutaredoxin) [Salibacteraceae bacterium]|jgi:arsenate reductase (glutaredoxin)|nr:arsenate reductase (glutaredoxin) [Crocinitomicaceae bacterium]MDA7730447.1 arsenate reductase (glutaredoxin) [Salibacteraceae bacterium]MDC1204590.1 arsenate reductase (glutaredoxin) [Salibacteraceae bacterium]|tara:strand:+ start:292 stop:639 length:348 start_codon:yes stop_codon:yes gene_type:complete
MEKFTIYHNPRCSKSRQTLAILQEHEAKIKVTEYLKESLLKEELEETIDKLGISPCELIRKGESEYVNNFKGKDLSEEDCLQAMIDYPKLMERPIVIRGNQAIIGRPPENVLKLL